MTLVSGYGRIKSKPRIVLIVRRTDPSLIPGTSTSDSSSDMPCDAKSATSSRAKTLLLNCHIVVRGPTKPSFYLVPVAYCLDFDTGTTLLSSLLSSYRCILIKVVHSSSALTSCYSILPLLPLRHFLSLFYLITYIMRGPFNHVHGLLGGLAIVTRLAAASGLAIFPEGSLSSAGLPSDCEATLYQFISCADETAGLDAYGYLDSDDPAVTKLVCRPTCGGAIGHMRTKVASACGTEEMVPGMSFVHLVDKFWSSWNQTCFTDPKTGKFCHGKHLQGISLSISI